MPKIKDLCVSIYSGSAPLVVGFFLDGPTIADKKNWVFEDGKQEIDNDLVKNHTYWEAGTYKGSVTATDQNGNSDSRKFVINVIPHQGKIITGFDQYEGVIIQGDSVGFSLSSSAPFPKITWSWGDKTQDSHGSNPSHQYQQVGTFTGKVTVIAGDKTTDYKEFAVKVLSNQVKNMVNCYIEVRAFGSTDGTTEFHTNEKLIFTAQLSGGTPPYTCVWNIENFEGLIVTDAHSTDQTLEYTFNKNGSYHITCIVRDSAGLKLTLSKTVVIQ